jgi:antibiotic biosynthesis monooxygenase (ABM) superfamily enzyme
MADNLDRLQDKTFTITQIMRNIYVETATPHHEAARELWQTEEQVQQQYMPGFASGGSFTVGGQGGTDSQMVSFMATPGEMVNVATPGQSTGNTIVININSTFAPDNEEQFKRMVRPAMVQLIREQGALT